MVINMEKILRIDTKTKGTALGDLYGIFFEDLNHAADGGLYAELIQNRSFEFDPIDNKEYHSLTAWEKVERNGAGVTLTVEDKMPLNSRNPHYLTVAVNAAGEGAGFRNLGFNTGIPIVQNEVYHFSCYIKTETALTEPLLIELTGEDDKCLASAALQPAAGEWKKYEAELIASNTDYKGRLVITVKEETTLFFDMVSLFPGRVYKNRENGLRTDIAKLLEELSPKFLRFPGGCLVHDGSLNSEDRDSLYRWKNTIGPVEKRPSRRNNWSYNQTLGLGYYEYFRFCGDIGAKPLPVLPAGYDPHHQRMVPIEELQPWIDDALDLIEFANGDKTTVWGSIRAELGQEEPFNLEYLGIGNEEIGEPFFRRYTYFHKAIKEKYPDIKLINTAGPFAAGKEYERGWASARENGSDLIDEHYYQSPEWFLANYHRYDSFKAEDPKVFLGEYASWGNTFYNALVEGAYMTGLEKNAHAVGLACYAPLLCNTDYVNWRPDMIWFNNHEVFGTANYYVQKLFMKNQGDYLLPVQTENFTERKESELPQKPIEGKLVIGAGINTEVIFRDIFLEDLITGETKQAAEVSLHNGESKELFTAEGGHYRLKLKGVKLGGTRGFEINFGYESNENKGLWELGGWQNQDCIVNIFVSGRASCLTQSLFVVEDNREYDLVLEIEGRTIKTYVDGILMNKAEDKLPVPEELYYSASGEKNGDILIKLVNVKEEELPVTIQLEGQEDSHLVGTRYYMGGFALEDMNSFEEPLKVSPLEDKITINGGKLKYIVPGQSLTVFRLPQSK